jgi:hypothetical protein
VTSSTCTRSARKPFWAAKVTPGRVCSASASGIAVIAVVAGWWPAVGQPSVTASYLVGLAVGIVFASVAWRIRRRPLEVRAVYRGDVICLFRTSDSRVFGQVTRALLRVVEHMADES